jgi:hypothetical protein
MRTIKLPCGQNVKVCEKAYSLVKDYKWSLAGGYPARRIEGKRKPCGKRARINIYMHRYLTGVKKGLEVDHINGDKLDNRLKNLRICTPTQNKHNVKSNRGSSKYKGVSYNKAEKKWKSYITIDGSRKNLGTFTNEDEAALAYNQYAQENFGEFALLNEVRK